MKVFAVNNEIQELRQMVNCLEQVFPDGEVISFTDPMLAIKSMYNCPEDIEIVFTALLMRHIDGLHVLENTRRCLPGVPVILVTHTQTYEYTAFAKLRGVDGCILYPITEDKVKEIRKRFTEP